MTIGLASVGGGRTPPPPPKGATAARTISRWIVWPLDSTTTSSSSTKTCSIGIPLCCFTFFTWMHAFHHFATMATAAGAVESQPHHQPLCRQRPSPPQPPCHPHWSDPSDLWMRRSWSWSLDLGKEEDDDPTQTAAAAVAAVAAARDHHQWRPQVLAPGVVVQHNQSGPRGKMKWARRGRRVSPSAVDRTDARLPRERKTID